jgi:hypothetical protein
MWIEFGIILYGQTRNFRMMCRKHLFGTILILNCYQDRGRVATEKRGMGDRLLAGRLHPLHRWPMGFPKSLAGELFRLILPFCQRNEVLSDGWEPLRLWGSGPYFFINGCWPIGNAMEHQSAITLITDPAFSRHDTGGGEHPEVPERLQVIAERLNLGPLAGTLQHLSSREALRSQLLTFHTEGWLFRFEEAVLSGRTYIDHPDNQVGYDSYEIATLSAGSGLVGIDVVEQEPGAVVFCQTRPPGHHAEPNQPYGFCFFNNCVIAARYWQRQYNRRRVCIFDFDAHHGNGIQTAFEEEADTAYVSIHEHPSFSYPGTGWAEERGLGSREGNHPQPAAVARRR